MRTLWILGTLATALSVAAIITSVTALISLADDSEEADESIHLVDRGEFTVDLVQQALQRYDDEGRDATVAYYNTPQSAAGEWYVFIFDESDRLIAHADPNQLGRDLKGDLGVDVTGYRFGDAMIGATERGLWVDYLFLNPATGNQEFKHSWVVRHDGLLFGSGWYQILPSSPLDVTKADPAEYTVAFVERAVRYYKAHGRDDAVAYYNTPQSADGDWYVFILDESYTLLANSDTSLLGRHIDDLVPENLDGRKWTEVSFTEDGLWLDYVFNNPATGVEGVKHSWVVRHDGVLIGSGWYE